MGLIQLNVPASRLAVACLLFMISASNLLHGQSVEEFDRTIPAEPERQVEPERQRTETKDDASKADSVQVGKQIVEQTNAFREEQGLEPLKTDPQLTKTAEYFASYMARTGRYGHNADENTPAQRAQERGYDYCIVLENIGYAYASTGFTSQELSQQFMDGWKNSKGHRKNMMDPDVSEIGVAVAADEQGQYFAVQMFGRPGSEKIQFEVSNRSQQEVTYAVRRRNSQRSFTLPPLTTRTHQMCRPSAVDFGWTEQQEDVSASDGNRFVIESTDSATGVRVRQQ